MADSEEKTGKTEIQKIEYCENRKSYKKQFYSC